MFYAHSAEQKERWEPLHEHLRLVGDRAAQYAAAFGAQEEARLTGLLHDLGKYSERFTQRLENPRRVRGLDHWSPGAWTALTHLKVNGLAAALAIQAHHIGLHRADDDSFRALEPRRLAERHPLNLTLTEVNPALLLERFTADGLTLPFVERSVFERAAPSAGSMLDVRMLFSTLVDADFIETEAHFNRAPDGERSYRRDGPLLEPERALEVLTSHVTGLAAGSNAAASVRTMRGDLLRACLDAGGVAHGLFTLSAPTGAGKTLAMLAFALRHASAHRLRRVVVAIPYLSIIEQTARIYRGLFEGVFGEHYVLEDHSLARTGAESEGSARAGSAEDHEDGTRRVARLLAENWDAPLVVTTNVQLLQSLFSNRPSACRKLHRLAGSVILFDEVQTLPPRLAVVTLATLSRLAERHGSTVVFATATQPAFDHLDRRVRKLANSGWAPREIVAPTLRLFERARRVGVRWAIENPVGWEALADQLVEAEQVLCIVNLKRHAGALVEALKQRRARGLLHLSTNLCPAHREAVLSEVRRRLDGGEPCLLVSTQCVEAGVDVDFPRVYRALGPLDGIAQAAGRCNRNGRLTRPGEVRVFLPEEGGYPDRGYENATSVTRALYRQRGSDGMDVDAPELFATYYRMLYDLTHVEEGPRELREALDDRDFEAVARSYRLIDQDTISVVVGYDPDQFTVLKAELKRAGRLTREWIRRARPHAVNLYRPRRDAPIWSFLSPARLASDEESDEWFIYLAEEHYDRQLMGLTPPSEEVWIA